MASSSSQSSQPAVATTLLGLPELLLGQRIVAHPALDPAARRALFRSCHALARLVLLHAPSSTKRVTHKLSSDGGKEDWSPTLARLFGVKWQPLLPEQLDLELRVESNTSLWAANHEWPPLPPPLPTSIAYHVSSLHLRQLTLTPTDLATWQLHDSARWPHLRHLTLHDCHMQQGAATQPLPPIPGLLSVSFLHNSVLPALNVATVLPLAAHAMEASLAGCAAPFLPSVVGSLANLAHLRTKRVVESQALEALLQHPTLEHVEINQLASPLGDLSQRPCRWKTLTIWGGVHLRKVASLPLAGLERLTIAAYIGPRRNTSDQEGNTRGLAALQQMHEGGRLVLAPSETHPVVRPWALQPGEGMFRLGSSTSHNLSSELLRLVLEAGRGVNALKLHWQAAPLPWLRDQAAPLLQQHAGKIHTLCFRVSNDTPESWCAGVLGALPTCVTHVQAMVNSYGVNAQMRALLQGGVAQLRHPLKLTMLPARDAVGKELTAERRQLAAGGGVAGPGQQQGSLLTLEVVRGR